MKDEQQSTRVTQGGGQQKKGKQRESDERGGRGVMNEMGEEMKQERVIRGKQKEQHRRQNKTLSE